MYNRGEPNIVEYFKLPGICKKLNYLHLIINHLLNIIYLIQFLTFF